MSALGIGVNVWIGWTGPRHRYGPGADRVVCQTGRVEAGPYPGGTIANLPDGLRVLLATPHWGVHVDGVGRSIVAEGLLFPIDDDGAALDEPAREPIEETA